MPDPCRIALPAEASSKMAVRFFVCLISLLVFTMTASVADTVHVVEMGGIEPEDTDSTTVVTHTLPMRKKMKHATNISAKTWKRMQRRAEKWFINVELPVTKLLVGKLRHLEIKGIKKLAEALKLGELLYIYAASAERRQAVMAHLVHLSDQTTTPAYHNVMKECSPKQFDENSMSYFSVLRTLENLQLEALFAYRRYMRSVLPRMDESMQRRGPWQVRFELV